MLLSSDVTELKDVRLTNGIVLDLHNFMNKTKNCTYLTYKNWIAAILGSEWPVKDPPTIKALRQSVIRLSSKLSKLRKAHNSEEKLSSITSFLEEEYHLPNVFVSRGRVIKSSPEPSSSSSSSVDWEKESLKAVNKKLCEELSEQSSDLEQAGQKLKTLQLEMHSKHRNNQKKIRRRDQQLKIKEKEVKDGKQLIKGLQKNVNDQETKIKQMKMNLDCLNHRAAYWKMKCTKLKDSNSDEIIDAIATEKAAQVRLSGEVELLESENLELRETVNELMAANEAEIFTFEKGKYKDNIRSCCYELLSLNVGVRNIEKVIDNQEVLFPEFTNFDDIVSKELFQQSPHDALTQEALQLIFKSFASTTQRLVIDHLPGGQYHSVSDPQIALEVASVPTTNVAPCREGFCSSG